MRPTLSTTVGLLRVVQRSGAWLPVGVPGREAVRGQQLEHLRVVVDDDRDLPVGPQLAQLVPLGDPGRPEVPVGDA
jgi:hypothetical protein